MNVVPFWFLAVLHPAIALLQNVTSLPELLQPHVDFYLHTRGHSQGVKLADHNLHLLLPHRETKFIVHGFMESHEEPYIATMTQEYLKRGDYNVVHVDWAKVARSVYIVASWRARYVGQRWGNLILRLVRDYNHFLDNIHVIAHSLGAHVAGHAGKRVFDGTGRKLYRITALDPARPFFEGIHRCRSGLASSDATIVDVIHTDAGVFGLVEPVGTADFYPNGGSRPQPFCALKQEDLVFNKLTEYVNTIFCSHKRSHFYFIQSINNVRYLGTSCTSYSRYLRGGCEENPVAFMGEDYNDWPGATGKFYIKISY